MRVVPISHWQDGRGLAVSLLLHLAALLLVWWHFNHAAPAAPRLVATMVELVNQPVIVPGPAGGASAPVHAPERTAPHVTGVTPKATTPPPDEMEARIRGFASLTAPETALPTPDNDGYGGGAGSGGGYALADYVRAQILRRWWPSLGTDAARGLAVALHLKMSRAGQLSDIEIVDQDRFKTDKQFHDMALSARNAAVNASPIALPPGHYDAVTEISITLDPKAVLR
jgi:hypothetical protein